MKRTLVALVIGVLVGSLLTGLSALTSANAADPAVGATTQAQPVAATGVPETATAPVAVSGIEVVVESQMTHPEISDPILGGHRLGTRSSDVYGARGHAVTNDIHSSVESYENRLLTKQQSTELLDIFKDSRGVRRLISSYDGNPDDAIYYVLNIDANEDRAANGTPWVTATLRADFASPEGRRAVEMQVYRTKINEGRLDNTPYVAWTQVGYLDAAGIMSRDPGYHPPGASGVAEDGLRTLRFKN